MSWISYILKVLAPLGSPQSVRGLEEEVFQGVQLYLKWEGKFSIEQYVFIMPPQESGVRHWWYFVSPLLCDKIRVLILKN